MPDTLTAGVVLAGRFELQSTLGRGGMATVYRAWDRLAQRPCAVKVLSEHLAGDEQFRRRFQHEAAAAQRLRHPNIVRVDDWGEAGPHHYIVMEYVGGGTLRDLLQRRGPLPQTLALRIAIEVADALAHAHASGVVHRDVKPENLLLAEGRRIKVADFGIARTVDAAALTRTGIVMGSARYLSPEQARGRAAGPRSDLYALGVVLFEMLAGKAPFDGDTAVAVAVQHVHDRPPPLRRFRADVAGPVAEAVERLLAKQEEDRYQTAGALAGDLRRQRALLPDGFEDRNLGSETPALGQRAAGETARMDLERPSPPTISPTAPLLLGGVAGATTAMPAAGARHTGPEGAGRVDRSHPTRAEPLGASRADRGAAVFVEPPGPARVPSPGGVPATRRGSPDIRSTAFVAVLLALVAVIGAQGYRFGQPRVTVPSLLGQSVPVASATAQTMGLRVVVAAGRQDAGTPAGLIVTQDPSPGRSVGKESVVRVVVSQGSGIVPDLRGLSLDGASRLVQAAGLRLRRIVDLGGRGSDEDGGDRRTIVFQLEAPGTHLAPDASVNVVLGAGVKRTRDHAIPETAPGREKDTGQERN